MSTRWSTSWSASSATKPRSSDPNPPGDEQMSGILGLAEHDGGSFKKTAYELLGKAVQLAGRLGTDVSAVVRGDGPAAELGAFGAKRVYQVAGDSSAYEPVAIADGLAAAIARAEPAAILAPASYLGKDALPRLVARLGAGLGSECTDLW